MSDNGDVDLKKGRRSRGQLRDPSTIDRLPPHSIESEQGILGCCLLNPNESVGECVDKLGETPEPMYDLRHKAIYEVLVEMYDRKQPIDLITVQQHLKDKHQLESVGGLAYLSALPDSVPSAANLEYYIEIVRAKFVLRKMILTCTEVVGRIYEHEGEVDVLLDEVERDIFKISESRVSAQAIGVKQLVHNAIETIERYHNRQGLVTGLSTGFADLDKMTAGLNPAEMIVIAGRPSAGKTSLAMNIAEHVCIDQKIPVGVFSLEMTAESLILRMLCSRSRVNLRNIREGFLAERDLPKLTGAAGKLSNAPLHIDETSGLTILQLRAKARRMVQQYGIKLLVIDYLQLMRSANPKAKKLEVVAEVSNGIKSLAKELKLPIIALSAMSRLFDREKRKPQMADLKESGDIEQDADTIGMLYKPSRDDEDDGVERDAIPVNLLIAKQRHGPTGDINLTFLKSYTRFESAARISSDDVPDSQDTMSYQPHPD